MYFNKHLSININSQVITAGKHDIPDIGDYQFFLVLKGTITISYPEQKGKYILQKNDVIVMDPATPFICGSNCTNTIVSVRLDPLFINELIPYGHVLHCNSIQYSNLNYNRISEILFQICSNFFSNASSNKMLSLLFDFADELTQNFIFPDSQTISDNETRFQERINQITHFMSSHYTQPLTLLQLADEMYLTPQYLSRFIKKHFQTNFTNLLTQFRLEHAYNELLHSADSITNIALNNGFPNVAAFHKVFRLRYGESPNAYRQQLKIEEKIIIPAQMKKLFLTEENRRDNKILSVNIDSLSASLYKSPWKDTINIGELSNAMKNSFHDSFLEYRRFVPVRHIRFRGLFSEEVLLYDKENKEYSFSNLDVIMNFFYNNGIIPFIELRSENPAGYVTPPPKTAVESSPQEYDAYALQVLPIILNHYLKIFGPKYLSKWRFEIWWKTDSSLCPTESPKEYATHYLKYSSAIRELVPQCCIGGPCFNICGNFHDFTDFIIDLSHTNICFDFISLAAFSYEVQSQYKKEELDIIGIVSPDPDHILNTFAMYHHYLRVSHYSNVPIFITEFGSTLCLKNFIYESVFQAAFLCKNMLGLSANCDCIAYYSLIDSGTHAPLPDTLTKLSNFGLISEKGVPKPALHAYHFLSLLGKNEIAQGDNYILTSSSKTRYELLCFHYTHFNSHFCFNSWEQVGLERTYDVFSTEVPYKLNFSCNCFPVGRYKVTQFSLNRGYGSALDKYLRILEQGNITSQELLSTIHMLREDELDYYKKTSRPRQDIFYFTCDGTFTLSCLLHPHEIVFYEIQRII